MNQLILAIAEEVLVIHLVEIIPSYTVFVNSGVGNSKAYQWRAGFSLYLCFSLSGTGFDR